MAYTGSVLILNASRQAVAWLENCLYPGYSFRMNEVYTAHFSLPADDAKATHLVLRALFELYENDGTSKGIFRIVDIEHTRMGKGVLITCRGEHVISTLLDDILIGEHEIAQTGATPTTETAIEYVLAQQTTAKWQFGTEAFARSFWYKWKDQSLLSALFGIPAVFGEDYIWTYNTASYPWTVTLAEPSATVSGYIAYNKNLEGIRKRQLTGEMYNRIYPYGYGEYPNQLTIASVNLGAEYLEDPTGVAAYGRIARVWNDQRYTDATSLKTAAQKLLTDHAAAPIYYEVDAADLSQLSDADVDALEIGSLVKVYDAEMGVTADVRVVTITKPDMLGQPGACSLELSNKIPEFDIEDDYGSPSTEDVNGTVGNLVPNYSFERLSGTVPIWWTLDGWEQSTVQAFDGVRSLKGTGTGKTAYSDKVDCPRSGTGLRVTGHAIATATTAPAELTNKATTSAPIPYCDIEGALAAISRQNASYDIIELWDLSLPSSPYLLSAIDASGATEDRSKPFKIYGTYLLCGNQTDNKLYVYNIADPSLPVLTSTYTLANAAGVLGALTVRNWVVFACCDDDTNGGFIEVIDIAAPALPVQLDSIAAVIPQQVDFTGVMAANDLLAVTASLRLTSPTGYTDPFSDWSNETNAYDQDDATDALCSVGAGSWCGYLELDVPERGYTAVTFKALSTAGGIATIDIDLYYGAAWHDLFEGSYTSLVYVTKTFAQQDVSQVRVRFYNTAAGARTGELYEVKMISGGGLYLYDIATPSAVTLLDDYGKTAAGYRAVVLSGTYAYLACDYGTDANKIVVIDASDPAHLARETAVGGSGTPNYTGSDALFLSGAYLVNVGAGTTGAQYAVSYWDITAPALPTLKVVKADITGDMDAAAQDEGLIVGVDVDNSKLRIVTGETADWSMSVRFYNAGSVLLDTIVAYQGIGSFPVTTSTWCRFEVRIPLSDVPASTTQLDVLLETNTGADSVYVDSLSIVSDGGI